MKPLALAILLTYLGGGFITNAYCQTYRWEAWAGPKPTREMSMSQWLYEEQLSHSKGPAKDKLRAATILWPGYWASRAAFWIVNLEIQVRDVPELHNPVLTTPIGG